MEARELRVGNYLDRNGLMQVLGIGSNNKLVIFDHYNNQKLPYGLEIDSFKGIPLTPEWLERAGFEYADGFADDYTKQPITLYNNPFKEGWTVENLFKQQITEDMLVVKYVHQLQNLYFALTGEELTIK